MSNFLGTTALIGYTGFVGSSLASQCRFDSLYNSRNIHSIHNRSFDLVVCCAAPGTKWLANKYPDNDRSAILSLIHSLSFVNTRKFVLISTIDVFGPDSCFDETTPVNPSLQSNAYGYNRFMLEEFCRQSFKDTLIIRLPALVGPKLRKNFLYDLAHGFPVSCYNFSSQIQLYPVSLLFSDMIRSLDLGTSLIHLSSPPFSFATFVSSFPFDTFVDQPHATSFSYDMRSIFAPQLVGAHDYSVSLHKAFSSVQLYFDFVSS